jgi:hypothetical protein
VTRVPCIYEDDVVPAHVERVVDEVIARAYLAVELGLEIDALARPEETLARLGLPPRTGVERAAWGSSTKRKRAYVSRAVREIDVACCVCGVVTHWERVGDKDAWAPAACPKHASTTPINWRAA